MGLIVPVACLTHCVLWLFVLITEGGVSARDSCDSELCSSSSFCTCIHVHTMALAPKRFPLSWKCEQPVCNASETCQTVYRLFIYLYSPINLYWSFFLSIYVSRFYLDVIFSFWLALSVETNLVWWCIMHHPPCVMRTCWFLSSVPRSQWGFIWLKNMTFCVCWAKSTPCFLTALVLASLPCGPVE